MLLAQQTAPEERDIPSATRVVWFRCEGFHKRDMGSEVVFVMLGSLIFLVVFAIILAARGQHQESFVLRPTAAMPPVNVPWQEAHGMCQRHDDRLKHLSGQSDPTGHPPAEIVTVEVGCAGLVSQQLLRACAEELSRFVVPTWRSGLTPQHKPSSWT
ncbi:hypothetical protein [Bradyrhizobium sp. 187]|uniref:hypothetical protein n=1 Tax=Bradyrhizobium sp. 187 TaxID=2782655 RepID=UPI001FFE693D|nr:hypothetical protein [Bradyrhizobium sp. 187]UPJ77119.1 hypothetical protein IVB19_38010 [Bradyrhizobium sp. 187]